MTGRNVKRVIGPLSPPPSAYTEDVVFTHLGGDAELKYTYERDGSMFLGGLRFQRVRAYRFRSETHTTLWHIEQAYDTLVEVEKSDWIDELVATQPSGTSWPWAIRHFLTYIDSAGAYEVAAERCEWIPEAGA